MSWPVSLEVYEALDALPLYGERHIDGKLFRLVAGTTPGDKLFQVVNRPCGLPDHFALADAVRFALRGELVPRPDIVDLRVPYACEECGERTKPAHNSPGSGCSACALRLCADCRGEHLERHEADRMYRSAGSPETQARRAEEHALVVGVVNDVFRGYVRAMARPTTRREAAE
jgi:hypothetical protein